MRYVEVVLPPRDMHARCLRCGKVLAEDERFCGGCGADRELEMAIAGELVPAIASLRKWLVVLGAILLGVTALLYEHARHVLPPEQLAPMLLPGVVTAAGMFVLCAFARRWPFGVSLVALSLFAGHTLLALVEDPRGTLSISIVLGLRIVFLFVLVQAVLAGHRVRRLRREAAERIPAARVV